MIAANSEVGIRSRSKLLMLSAISMLLVWYAGRSLSTAIEEAPIKANPFPSIGYLASARLAMIIIGLVGIFKHNPKLMTSAVVFFISAYFEALVQLLKHALLLWNGGSLMCTKRLQVSILDGCFWLDMACSVALMGQAIVPLVAAVVIAAESCVIFKESFESLVIADNEEKSKWSFSSVQDAVPTAFEPRTSSRRLSFGSPISNSMALANEQKRVVSVDTVQMVIVAWALAWHAVTDMFLMFLIVVDAERQTDSHVIELRLALSIVGMIGVLIRHPPFMSIAVGSLLQAAMHNFFIIVGHSALLLKGGDFVTRAKLWETDWSIISDVLRLVCIALWTLALVLAAITVALKCDDVAPPSRKNNTMTNRKPLSVSVPTTDL